MTSTAAKPTPFLHKLLTIAAWLIRFAIAAFFVFVGYWKALGPLPALAEHHAWVAGFAPWFIRTVGWSEIICALMLVTPALGILRYVALTGALTLFVNNVVAFSTHISRDEYALTPQNIVIGFLLILLVIYLKKAAR